MTNKLIVLLLCFWSALSLNAQNIDLNQISLDGEWQIIFDDQNKGKNASWFLSDEFEKNPEIRNIQVPSCWEVIEQDYEGVAFYKKTFNIPIEWKDRVIRLQFGAVNYMAEVWLNDEVVGYHEGGFTPFEFRVDRMAKYGENNTLTLRIAGPIILSEKEVDGIKPLETPQWRGGITGGIWQSVKLISTNKVYVDDVFVQPDIHEDKATFHVELNHAGRKNVDVEIKILVSEIGSEKKIEMEYPWSLHPGINKKSWDIKLPDAKYWSPDHPNLYKAEVMVLLNGEESDSYCENFGMRELTIKNKDFYLNGKRIYIKATFFEGLYSNGIARPDSDEMIRREIQLAKEAGFNMIRPWRRPPAPRWLDFADEMGVLVVGSPVLECMRLPLSSPQLPARVKNEVVQLVLRDRNRACVVQWELFNELHRPVLKQLMHPMAMVTRDLDPTRLILDESGGWAFGANMYLPNEYEPTTFNDIHNYPGPFISNRYYDGYLSIGMTKEEKKKAKIYAPTPGRNVVPGLMSFVSELGYGSLPDLDLINAQFEKEGNPLTPAYRYHKRLALEHNQLMKESGFDKLYRNMSDFYIDQQKIHGAANKRMIEAVRSNPEIDGYCIHALSAGDWILGAGLIDLWRNPKGYAYEGTKAANQPQIISIRTKPRNVYADKGMTIELIGINDLQSENALIEVEISNELGDVVFEEKINTTLETGIAQLMEKKLQTSLWEGDYKVKVIALRKDKTVITRNNFSFHVFQNDFLKVPETSIAVIDKEGFLSKFMEKKGIEVLPFTSRLNKSIPVLVTGTNRKDGVDREATKELIRFVKKGGTALYIEGGVPSVGADPEIFPFSARFHAARGLWTCMPHMVHEHSIFKGLPSNGVMREIYEHVWASTSIRDIETDKGDQPELIAGTVAFDWFSEGHKMHYSGPGETWYGADVAEIPFGKGKCLVSQLTLVRQLGKDPVADKILYNFIEYLTK